DRDLAPADADVLGARIDLRGPAQAACAEVQLLDQQRQATKERQLPDRVRVQGGRERTPVHADLPGARNADSHCIVVAASPPDPFARRLAPVEDAVAWSRRGLRRGRFVRRHRVARGAYRAAFAARLRNRSTWPPVSTIRCVPV